MSVYYRNLGNRYYQTTVITPSFPISVPVGEIGAGILYLLGFKLISSNYTITDCFSYLPSGMECAGLVLANVSLLMSSFFCNLYQFMDRINYLLFWLLVYVFLNHNYLLLSKLLNMDK